MTTSTATESAIACVGTALRAARRRWPSVAGIALAAAISPGLAGGAEVAPILAAAGFVYLGAAALRRRSSAWPIFLASVVVITAAKVLNDAFDPTDVFVGVGVVLAAFGLFPGAARPASGLPPQAVAMLVVGLVAALAPAVHPDLAGYLVAAGLLGHAFWDLWHHRRGAVVARSMAEFCLVLDTLLAGAILLVTVL